MRNNNGVPAKVSHDVKHNRASQGGTMREGSAANDVSAKPHEAEMDSHHSPKGSSGTEKDMGGVGNREAGGKWTPFEGEH